MRIPDAPIEHTLIDSVESANRAVIAIKSCQDESELTELLRPVFAFLGAESYVFVTLRRDGRDRESRRYLIGCASAWCQLYNQRNWYAIDPFLRHAISNSSPLLGSAVVTRSAGQVELLCVAARNGFRSVMVIPAHTGGVCEITGVLYVGASAPPESVEPGWMANRVLLRGIAVELLEWFQAQEVGNVKLDETDLELLRLDQAGFTAEDSARELRLTTSQVNNRFRRINAQLGVTSKRLAVARATGLGLLSG